MFQLGYNILTEKPIVADMEHTGHACIVGGTGAGKSVATLYILYNLLKNYSAKITICDFKKSGDYEGVSDDFAEFSDVTGCIAKVKVSDAKLWLLGLQDNGRSYSSIHTIRGVVRPAFAMAVEDDLLRKNPFDFELAKVLVNDSVQRDAITPKQERAFLKFVREDEHFSRYYDGMFLLFKTGLRVSELCGLTVKDIDLDERTFDVNKQLQYTGGKKAYIEKTKTNAGTRVLPMSDEVYEAFKRVISGRKKPKVEIMIDGYAGFLFLDDRGKPMLAYQWEKKFQYAVAKYNKIYKVELPKITPHVCRHTYCSNMAKSGISVKTLQYLMGHSDIATTLNVYTHLKLEDAQDELEKLKMKEQIKKEMALLDIEEAKKELRKVSGV